MKQIPTYHQFIESVNEAKKDENKKYSYGCSMLYFDFPNMKILHDKISEDDVYSGSGYGLETEPHITLLYGLHSNEIEDEIILDISSKGIKSIGLGNLSVFQNEKFDVLKLDAEAPFLHEINDKLSKLPHTTDFTNYRPHCTIAYLKPGTGKKYANLFKGRIYEVFPTRVIYSKPDGTKIEERFELKK